MRRSKTESTLQEYLECKSSFQSMCEYKKRMYEAEYVHRVNEAANESDSRLLWKILRFKNRGGKNDDISADDWKNYYCQLYGLNEQCENAAGEGVMTDGQNINFDITFNDEDICWAIGMAKDNKAPGRDGILNKVIKTMYNKCAEFGPLLKKLFNAMTIDHVYPRIWTTGIITNIYKGKGERTDPGNYRGLTLMSNISKLYTKLLSDRLWQWLDENEIINCAQAGFRRQYETVDNVLVLKTIIDNSLTVKRTKTYLCFIDFEKAFDKVNRELLWSKLLHIGLP